MKPSDDPAVGIDQGPGAVSAVEQRAKGPFRKRSIEQLRGTLSMLCNFIWHRKLRPGEHLWSIPVDHERDFDCILSDAIDELADLRQQQEQLGWRPIGGGDEQCSMCGATWRPSHGKERTHRFDCGLEYRRRAEAAEASLTALRREQEQLREAAAQTLAAQEEALDHSLAWALRADAAEQQLAEMIARGDRHLERAEKAEKQLADQSAALSQIVQEMKKAKDWGRIDELIAELKPLISGSARPHQTKEQEPPK